MSLSNYQDVSQAGASLNAGFQFEFHCGNCGRRWRSPFKSYRRGRFFGLFYEYGYYVPGYNRIVELLGFTSHSGEKRAKDAALQDAMLVAEQRYHDCPGCKKTVCEDCWDARAQRCESCRGKGEQGSSSRDSTAVSSAGAGLACPNCQAPFGGGRFCAECGFDRASTHKSCPSCGVMCARAARFCTDCGHGF